MREKSALRFVLLAFSLSCLPSFGPAQGAWATDFVPWGSYHTGNGAAGTCEAAADFNGDGCVDIAVGSMGSFGDQAPIRIFLNDSSCSGKFTPGPQVWTGIEIDGFAGEEGPAEMLALDMNTDGLPDLIGIGQTQGIFTAFNNGDGTFAPSVVTPNILEATYLPVSLEKLNLNNDGIPDLAIMGFGTGATLLVGLAAPLGRFAYLDNISPVGSYYYLSAGDLDGDGRKAEIVITSSQDGQPLRIVQVDAELGYTISEFPQPNWMRVAAVGDFNGDGKQDIATLGVPDGAIYLNTTLPGSPLSFDMYPQSLLHLIAYSRNFKSADFNRDGRDDLLFADGQSVSGAARLCLTGENGLISECLHTMGCDMSQVPPGETCNQNNFGIKVLPLDVDHDGWLDVAIVAYEDDLSDQRLMISRQNAQSSVPLILGDLNCDGAVDMGDINPFSLALTSPAGYSAAFPTCSILNGDINQDGVVSLADVNPFIELLGGGAELLLGGGGSSMEPVPASPSEAVASLPESSIAAPEEPAKTIAKKKAGTKAKKKGKKASKKKKNIKKHARRR